MRPVLFGLMVMTATACGGSSSSDNTDTKQPVDRDDASIQEMREQALATKALERAPEPSPGIIGEVPDDILSSVRQDLDSKISSMDTPVLQRAEAVIWPDGSMGCPTPGVSYPQVEIPGYHVVYDVNGKIYDYRVRDSGYFQLCDGTVRPAKPYSQPAS